MYTGKNQYAQLLYNIGCIKLHTNWSFNASEAVLVTFCVSFKDLRLESDESEPKYQI